jgi:hypothetical protein
MHLTRTMTMGDDGLNHQGSWVTIFDATTLEPICKGEQTAGHSFGIGAGLSADGKFVDVDLGDNYPRGIIAHLDGKPMIVYSFKTLHGCEEVSPAGVSYPLYKEISSKDKSFYKWSNDNNTYTELASPAFNEVDDGFVFFFLGESPALDNSKAGAEYYNSPRNIGFTKISKDLEKKLSPGGMEKGGLFDFGG